MLLLGDLAIDLNRRVARRGDDEVTLTPTEAALLAYLSAPPGRTRTREELLRDVWEYSPKASSRAVDFTVMRLRRKIEVVPDKPVHLVSVWGAGYRLEVPVVDPGFVGRRADLARLVARVDAERLVTLTGPGGVGKTRLLDHFLASRPGARRVSLAAARTVGELAEQVAALLQLGPRDDDVGEALAALGPTLLALDNLEQIPGAGELVASWLAAAPGLRVVATSRSALGVQPEAVLAVEPLPAHDGARLFLDRAREARPTVEAPADAVRALIERLDGLPLAIELAAARCRVLSVAQLADRLAASVLATPGGDGRHATLANAVRWSTALLSDAEATALARCTVFRSPFDLDAAEAVLGDGAVELLDALARAALLRVDRRFSLLETVRAVASADLPAHDPAFGRHAAWVVGAAEPLARVLRHERQDAVVLDALAALRDDLVAVTERFGGSDLAVRATLALSPLLEVRGPSTLHRALLDAAVATGLHAARVRWARGRFRYVLGDPGAHDDLAAALAGAEASWIGHVYGSVGDHLQSVGRYDEALAAYDRAIEAHLAQGDRYGEAAALAGRGLACVETHRLGEARDALHAALALRRVIGDLRGEVVALDHLGHAEGVAGRPEVSRARFEEALALVPALRDRRLEANVRTHLANALARLGEADAAVACWTEALQVHRELRNVRFEAVCLGNLGRMALGAERWSEARDRFEVAQRLALRVGDRATAAALRSMLGQALHADGHLAEARRELEAALEAQLALGRAHSAAHTRVALGPLLVELGEPERAEEVLLAVGDAVSGAALAHLVALRRARGEDASFDVARALGAGPIVDVLLGVTDGRGVDAAVARRVRGLGAPADRARP